MTLAVGVVAGRLSGGVIAVVGCDGAGKSRLTADLAAQLGRSGPAAPLYLGQDSGNILDHVRGLPLIGHAIGTYLVRRSARAHAESRQSTSPDIFTALSFHLLSRWRYRKFRHMLGLVRQGILVVADRYPQAEVPGFYFDGPGFTTANGASRAVSRLARREYELYRRMADQVPTLLVRLNVDADTAQARKPDHALAMLREKVRVIPTLRFNGAPIVDLDGCAPYPYVLEAALAAARSAIAERCAPDR